MTFQIKAFKSWRTEDGGGYQFNLYYNGKKFAWVHNDGNGGCIDIEFADSQSKWKESPFKTIWDNHVKSLGKWKSKFGAINGTEWFEHDDETAIGILVEDYEMAKHRKKGTLFRLVTDSSTSFRVLNIKDMVEANTWLENKFGKGSYELV